MKLRRTIVYAECLVAVLFRHTSECNKQIYWPSPPSFRSAQDPSKATREYAIYSAGKLVTVLGGRWTTAMALADKVCHAIH